jgi:lipoyl-dependent peroxiredoxin
MQVLYTATATATGGRQGRVRSSDGVLDLQLAYPKELGGPGGDATKPEQLFAAGYAACFENALCAWRASAKLARIAHDEVCPYSRATRDNLDVSVVVV